MQPKWNFEVEINGEFGKVYYFGFDTTKERNAEMKRWRKRGFRVARLKGVPGKWERE